MRRARWGRIGALGAAGAPVADTAGGALEALPPTAPFGALAWQINVSVLGNRFLRGGIARGCLVTAALAAVFFSCLFGFSSGDLVVGLKGAALGVGITFGIFGAGLFGYLVLVGFHQPIGYRLTDEGAKMLNISRMSKGINRATMLAGFIAGKPSAVAAGAAARGSEVRYAAWRDVKTVEEYPAEHTMVIHAGFLETIHVFCTAENHAQVREFIAARTPQAKRI